MTVTDYTIGFDTAMNTVIDLVDKLRDTCESHARCNVVEVMGRNAGFLAMYVGLAVGATAVLVPEKEVDFEKDVIEKIRQARFNGFTHYMIVVAEGAGSASDIAKRIKQSIDLDPRVTVLGHIQRGGSPSARDRILASRMGDAAVEALMEGQRNVMIGIQNGEICYVPIAKALQKRKQIVREHLELVKILSI